MDNYVQLVQRISNSSGISVEEIERKIEAKRAKLSGLVSKEGAAQIVAAEIGVNLDKERLKIAELAQGMKRAHIVGKVIEVGSVKEYNKNGREGKVVSLTVADESSNIRVVLWDVNHIALVEEEKIKLGDVLDITNAMVRNGELHLSSFADIKQSKEEMKEVIVAKSNSARKLSDVKPGDKLKTRAFIVQSFEPRYFEVCPECGKKAVDNQCMAHGKVEAKKRAILSIVVDDGTSSMRGVIFGENINLLGLTDEDVFNLDKFMAKKDSILGEEKIFSGSVRSNQLYNTIEFNIDGIESVDAEMIIKEMEAKG